MSLATVTEEVKAFVRDQGLVRPRDVADAGFPTHLLYRLRDRGELIQVAPGLFKHPDAPVTDKHTYAAVAKLVPRGVICLLSALAFHEVGVQTPRKVWMALDRDNRRRPKISDPPVEFVWFSGAAFEEGQHVHEIEGADVSVYSPAKTVADLFRYRHKLGIDVAIEALREGWRRQLFTVDELQRFADICSVSTVLRPYLRAVTAS